jgi:hypothetical protein
VYFRRADDHAVRTLSDGTPAYPVVDLVPPALSGITAVENPPGCVVPTDAIYFDGKCGIGYGMEKHPSGHTSSVKKGRKARLKGLRGTRTAKPKFLVEEKIGKQGLRGTRTAKPKFLVEEKIGKHTAGRAVVLRFAPKFYPTGQHHIVPAALADALGLSVTSLARTLGLPPENLQRTKRAETRKTQERLRETTEIIQRVHDWAGGDIQAMAWYRAEPIPAFGGRTAEALVKEGRADAVRDYLDAVANGSFA